MACRSFEIWLTTAPLNSLIQTRNAYVLYMTAARLKGQFIDDWLTENYDLICAQLLLREQNDQPTAPVPAPEGVDQLHTPSRAYLRHIGSWHRKDEDDDRGVRTETA